MLRYLYILVVLSPLADGLLRPLLAISARTAPLRAGRGPDRGEPVDPQSRRGDDDPYAFVADADLAASYADIPNVEGAATLLVGVDLPGAALDFDASISELSELAKGAGLHAQVTHTNARPHCSRRFSAGVH